MDQIDYMLVVVETIGRAAFAGQELPLLITVHDDGTYVTGAVRTMVAGEVPFAEVDGEGLAAVAAYGEISSALQVHIDPDTGEETFLDGKIDGLVMMAHDVTGRRLMSIADADGNNAEFYEKLPMEFRAPMEAAIARSTLSRA